MARFRIAFLITAIATLLLSIEATDKFAVNHDQEAFKHDVLDPTDYRLPKTIYPVSYDIKLVPELKEDFTFYGIVQILAVVKAKTDSIVLHHGDISIYTTTVTVDEEVVNITSVNYNKVTEKYQMNLNATLEEGSKVLVVFSYTGVLSDKMIGFYRSSYTDAEGNLKWLAATQFQSTHARHAFPCFDEPSFKAVFQISIQREEKYRSLSNMPLNVTQKVNGSDVYWDIFTQSIPMSTYLVAFVVSEFKSLSSGDFRVWARENAINQARYALDIGPKALDYLSQLFQQKYQIPKMDMVAVPDFSAGAMENWGLVTYRETRMLYDEKESSAAAQQSVVDVIVHELTHMWFGNQVTPAWWSYLWLSEGFARYFQYFGTAKLKPSWKMDQQFIVNQLQAALAADAIASSQPMTRDVSSQSQIGEMGGTITYAKGASIIRMMSHIFGQEQFDRGLRNYLENNKLMGVAQPEQLWAAFENYQNVDVIMNTWTRQAGYPVITVSIDEGSKEVTLHQKRFLLRDLEPGKTDGTWWIPLTWVTQISPDFVKTTPGHWFHEKNDKIKNPANPGDWIIFNVQLSGFYRVNYDNVSWYRIISFLNGESFEDVHVLNRAAIVDDLLNLARAGLLEYKTALDGLQYIKQETNYLPIKAAINALDYLSSRFNGQEYYDLLTKHIFCLIKNIYNNLGYEDREKDDRLTVLLRRELNNLACKLGHKGCIEFSIEKFQQWKTKGIPIKPNLRSAVYCTAIEHGTKEDWNYLREKYLSSNVAAEQLVILNALGCSQDVEILEKYLVYAVSSFQEAKIRKQDSTAVFSAVYSSSLVGAEFILDFVAKHHERMVEYYGNLNSVASIISGASKKFSTPKLIERFERFIQEHSVKFASISKSLKSSLSLAKYELDWYNRNNGPIVSWLQEFEDSDVNPTTVTQSTITEPTTTTVSSTQTPVTEPTTPKPTTPKPTTPKPTTPKPTTPKPTTPKPTTPKPTTPKPTTPKPTTPKPTIPEPEEPDDMNNTTDYRLPQTIIPKTYAIMVEPFLEKDFTFNGYVQIVADVRRQTNEIFLHSVEITLYTIKVTAGDKSLRIARIRSLPKYNFIIIQLAEKLKIGTEINIEIRYTGILNTEMRGFYRSSYENDNGEIRWLAATHMEPVGARKMFPCFDEPALKATFKISVKVPLGYHAISNMPVETTNSELDGRELLTFQITPKMSTYLTALVVSDFANITNKTTNHSVYARSNAIDQASYALSVMPPLVEFFEKSLGLKYQLPKLDMVALPDFSSGAMENWGLLTYRETNVLYSEGNSTLNAKQAITNVISHEISHQWFGNLVSPLWWKYLWLNEGFARYFQYFGTAEVKKDWSLESQFVAEEVHSAFSSDSAASIHAMTHDVYSPTEIRSIFDSISYAKAASVLRMFQKTFGSKVFYGTLRDYLNALQYGTATPEDLYHAFHKQLQTYKVQMKHSTTTILDSWTAQPGYPVIHVKVQDHYAQLTQERFILKRQGYTASEQKWYVPITWTPLSKPNFNNTVPSMWLAVKDGKVKLFKKPMDDILIFNLQQSGYYRVNYADEHWLRIASYLDSDNFRNIHEINRAAILDDVMNLGRSDYVDYGIVLTTTKYLARETSYAPWRAFFRNVNYLHTRFMGTEVYDLFKVHLNTLLTPVFEKLDFDEKECDSHADKLLKRYLRDWACRLENDFCVLKAARYFRDWRKDGKPIPGNIQSVAFCTAIKIGDQHDWSFLWSQYKLSKSAADKHLILSALACSTNPENLKSLLLAAIKGEIFVRSQDKARVFTVVSEAGLTGMEVTMDVIMHYYDDVHKYFGDTANVKKAISSLSKRLSTEALNFKFKTLLKWLATKEPTIRKSLKSYEDNAAYEQTWYNEHAPRILEWLADAYSIEDYRLPPTLLPYRYNLSVTPFFDAFTFHGSVKIDVRVLKSTSNIVLNAHELEIKSIKVYETPRENQTQTVQNYEILSHATNVVTQKLTIFLKKIVHSVALTIEIDYSGTLNKEMRGFYRTFYTDAKGQHHWLASTQFQPTHARSAFPCFDEPALKATFIVNVERPSEYRTLSNMPLRYSKPSENDRVWDVFDETEVMSTYALAFIVSEFAPVRNEQEIYNVWGRPEIAIYGDYAQIVAVKSTKFMESYTGLNYTLPKMDLVGLPELYMGGMENWGLITFKEWGLFYDSVTTPTKYKNIILGLVAHEVAHMWFGNLVTCEWWDNVWLNEGFAEYFQWLTIDAFRPEYDFLQTFGVEEIHQAMDADTEESPRAMTKNVVTPSDIENIFDKFAYAKSASILRMVHHTFGDEVFQRALSHYLGKHKYGAVRAEDLWDSFEKYIRLSEGLGNWNMTVKRIMSTWTDQPGVPVVYATLNYNVLTLSQERFYLTGNSTHEKTYYWIPITIATQSEPYFNKTSTRLWLGPTPLRISQNVNDKWFVVNVQQVGYYRVNYDEMSWWRLIDQLHSDKFEEIATLNRAQIVGDLFALARGDYVDYRLALNASLYLTQEHMYAPWKAFEEAISFIAKRYDNRFNSDLLAMYISYLTNNAFEAYGFEEKSDDTYIGELTRELILRMACKYGNEVCIKKSLTLFRKWRYSDSKWIPRNAKSAVYCTAIEHGTSDDWTFLWNQFVKTNFATEKQLILEALGCTRNQSMLYSYLDMAISFKYSMVIRKLEAETIFKSVYNAGERGVDVILEYLIANYREIYNYYKNWDDVVELFSTLSSQISHEDQIDKLEVFIENNKDNIREIRPILEKVAQTARRNARWFREHSIIIDEWLIDLYDVYEKTGKSGSSTVSALNFALVTLISLVPYLLSRC